MTVPWGVSSVCDGGEPGEALLAAMPQCLQAQSPAHATAPTPPACQATCMLDTNQQAANRKLHGFMHRRISIVPEYK